MDSTCPDMVSGSALTALTQPAAWDEARYRRLLNPVVTALAPSGIRRFFDLAETMTDVISLGVGEPDFQTPWHIRDAGIQSLKAGKTRYTSNAGLMELRQEIAAYMNRKYSLEYAPQGEILVTVGGSEAIDCCIRALLSAGDEVIIPEPSFVCYPPIVALCGGKTVFVHTRAEDEFRLTGAALRAAITPKTKLLVLPFPNNPTGAVMRREHLEEIAEVLRGTDIMVLSDEIYAELTYGSAAHVSAASISGMRDRTVVAGGFSKSFSMTGWRLGYACGPAPVIKEMTKIHQYAIMSAPTTAQHAAIEALRFGDEDVKKMADSYDSRRRLVLNGFRSLGCECFEPHGAFYIFPSIRQTGLGSEKFCERLLKEKLVAVIPGTAFGSSGEGFVRVSYSYSVDYIKRALAKIGEFLSELRIEN